MPHVIAHAMTSCTHHMACTHRQAGAFMACLKLTICVLFTPAEQHLLKLSTSHFNTLKMQCANQNMLEKILIAMGNENTNPIAMRTSGYVVRNL